MRFLFLALIAVGCVRAGQQGASLPAIGVAVSDSAGRWCAEFSADSAPAVVPGSVATLVFTRDSVAPSVRVRVVARNSGQCPAAFAQSRWISYAAFTLERLDSVDVNGAAGVALIVAADVRWTRDSTRTTRGDVDGDGVIDEVHRCAADEGEHFTVWTVRDGRTTRRWHEYFDWGAIVDPTCSPGDDGRETPPK